MNFWAPVARCTVGVSRHVLVKVRNPEYYSTRHFSILLTVALPDLDERTQDDKSRIQSIGKMVGILGCFSTVDRHLSLGQIAAAAGLPRPTAHRMLSAMREIGFIEQDRRNGNYSLGIRLFELGSLAIANLDLLREAKPFMDRLSRLTDESVHLGVFNGFEVIVV